MSTFILFFKARKYLLWLMLIVGIVAGGWYLHHSIYEEGIRAQQGKDAKEYAAAVADANAKTLANQRRADKAELNYATEHANLQSYVASHPLTNASQLCLDAPIVIAGTVPRTSKAHSGNVETAATAAVVQSVRAGNPYVPANRLRLLDAAATLADTESAVIREYQATEEPQ